MHTPPFSLSSGMSSSSSALPPYAPKPKRVAMETAITTRRPTVTTARAPTATATATTNDHELELPRAKTNSERGKEFRAKRKKYEAELEAAVYRLRTQVTELSSSRTLCERQRRLSTPLSDSGSLVRLIREYFALFRFGLRDPAAPQGSKRVLVPTDAVLDKIRRQESFLTSVMDDHATVGEKMGPAASIAQWRLYTLSHDSLRNEPETVAIAGSADLPTVVVRSNIRARISRDTFRFMFPGALNREDLVQKFVHREVTYKSTFRFQFNDDGKIACESADIEFVEGLQHAGFALDEIAELMQLTVVTPNCSIPEPTSSTVAPTHKPAQKLSLGFLLSSDVESEDELGGSDDQQDSGSNNHHSNDSDSAHEMEEEVDVQRRFVELHH